MELLQMVMDKRIQGVELVLEIYLLTLVDLEL
jgi:hypothetical protein